MMKIVFFATAAMACVLAVDCGYAQIQPKVFVGAQCGNTTNLFQCAQFNQPNVNTQTISQFNVDVPSRGKLIVTWSGTAYCGTDASGSIAANYQVDFQLRPDARAPVLNGPGGGSVGEQMFVLNSPNHIRRQNYTLTLTRVFNVRRGERTFRLMGKANWKDSPAEGNPFCLFNGGVMTGLFLPQ